jgi:cell division protease FtsH
MEDNIDLEVLARRTPGFTGADLANLVNEAALLAARHGKKKVDMKELDEAIERVISGPERKSRLISEEEKKIIAYHESGHAIVGHVLPTTDPIHKISIIARGQALGYTLALPSEDRFLTSRSYMLDNIAMLLGGRVAEEVAMGDITTGASNDIERATKTAKQMVMRFGMSDKLGPQTFGDANHEVFLGRDFSANADYSLRSPTRSTRKSVAPDRRVLRDRA